MFFWLADFSSNSKRHTLIFTHLASLHVVHVGFEEVRIPKKTHYDFRHNILKYRNVWNFFLTCLSWSLVYSFFISASFSSNRPIWSCEFLDLSSNIFTATQRGTHPLQLKNYDKIERLRNGVLAEPCTSLLLVGAAGKSISKGHWKGWALKIETFLGPEMATSEAAFRKPLLSIKILNLRFYLSTGFSWTIKSVLHLSFIM